MYAFFGNDCCPAVAVTFPNGHKDTLALNFYSDGGSAEERLNDGLSCAYLGHLENDPDSCVAMTGCPRSEDVKLTILSRHSPVSQMFTWKQNGIVEMINGSHHINNYQIDDNFLVNPKHIMQGMFLDTFLVFFLTTTLHLDNVTDNHIYIPGSSQIFRVSELVSV